MIKKFIFLLFLSINLSARVKVICKDTDNGKKRSLIDRHVNNSRTMRDLDELAEFYNLNKFIQLSKKIKFYDKLIQYPELTIFAPTDSLIDDLDIDEKSAQDIENFFNSLIVHGRYFSTDLPISLDSLANKKINPSKLEFVITDLKFKNGVLHIISYIENYHDDGKL
ncbi:hypothetical protein M1446_02265 [Candidatus Dependentiae bacterium]|nr:hypothetical protein [Candidatus Dependentiae bacterium]